MTTLLEANGKFTMKCFHRLTRKHPRENLLFSPVNLITILAQLLLASGAEQAAQIEKVLHWDEVKEDERPIKQRCPIPAKTYGQAANRLMLQEEIEVCQKPRPQPETAYRKQRPNPEPMHPKPSPEPVYPEPTCPPNSRPCPEPYKPLCPEKDVPEYECETPEVVQAAFSKILADLYAPNTNYSLIVANKGYIDNAITMFQKFIYCNLKLYQSDVEKADIRNAPELVRETVNLWVAIRTHGKIMDLFPKNSFDCLAQALVTNVLCFKGQWKMKFNKELTVESPFYQHYYPNERYCPTVLLMNRKGIYNTATVEIGDIVVQVLEIPYKNNELSLVVLLPTDCSPGALQQLEEALTYERLLDCYSLLKPAEVDVFIPRFRSESSLYPIDYLDLQNLNNPEKADFSESTSTEKAALTRLIHDTFIEIDEEGGEEAEAPCYPIDKCPTPEDVAVVANHPFLYYIQHNCTQSIIALGRFSRPE